MNMARHLLTGAEIVHGGVACWLTEFYPLEQHPDAVPLLGVPPMIAADTPIIIH